MNKNKKIEDLIKDKSFLNWVNKSNPKDSSKWDSWSEDNPERKKLLDDAKVIVDGFSFKKESISTDQVNDSWKNFSAKIQDAPPQKRTKVISFPSQLLKYAAIFLIGIATVFGVKNWMTTPTPELIVFQTSPTETNTFELPDGSTLTLNTNSKVEFYDDFLTQKNRIVELEGEGYFEVVKQEKGKTFQVKTKDISVNVVGTAFNVNSKRTTSIVSLTEGRVNLVKGDFDKKELEAGQTAKFNNSTYQFDISTDQTEYWRSWTLQKWSFGKETSIQEILERIEETFGLRCSIKDPKILSKKASGDVSVENKEILFEALSVLLDLEFQIKNNELIISSLN